MSPLATLAAELHARIALIEDGDDRVAVARAHIERALVAEASGDLAAASAAARSALTADPELWSAHHLLRRYEHGRPQLQAMLEHLEHELESAGSEDSRSDLLAEKARLLHALGSGDARRTWEQALAHVPLHAASLKGLEIELALQTRTLGPPAFEALVAHLARMADAYVGDPALAAWLHVERAVVLERRLGRVPAARAALEKALLLDGGIGPVRDALVSHVSRHEDFAALVKLLDEEGQLEATPERSARLELDAATIASARFGESAVALKLLTRAFARAPTTPTVDMTVVAALAHHAELAGDVVLGMRARRARLAQTSEPRVQAHERRMLAAISEREHDVEHAITDLAAAFTLDPADATLAEELDRVLAVAGRHEDRVSLWLTRAAGCDDASRRTRMLGKAAELCENELGRPADAQKHLRAAWVVSPSDPVVHDALGRLLVPDLPPAAREATRALATLYAQAGESAADPDRRVAFLEKAAVLHEDLLSDLPAAAASFEKILALEPDRRGAVLGLERVSARSGDGPALARARLLEARLAADPIAARDLRVRAAEVLAKTDAARALKLTEEVLTEDPAHDAGRALEARLHEDAGRWQKARDSIRARIQGTRDPRAAAALWIAHAVIGETRLHDTNGAVASLTAAHALDPSHPVPEAEIVRLLALGSDVTALRDARVKLARGATTPQARVAHLLAAAELSELRLADAPGAEQSYRAALTEIDDELVVDRLARVLDRTAAATGAKKSSPAGDPLAKLLASRIDHTGPSAASASVRLAARLLEIDQEPAMAASLLESVLTRHPENVAALRMSETLARSTGSGPAVAIVLSRQAESFVDVSARRGSLWALAALQEWQLAEPAQATFRTLSELAPEDAGALEGVVRLGLASSDAQVGGDVLSALRALGEKASSGEARWVSELLLALLLDVSLGDEAAREADARYRRALSLDPRSLTAARGALRLSSAFVDTEGILAASLALADLAPRPADRAQHLLAAATILLTREGDGGARTKAVALLDRALVQDPDSIAVATRLGAIRLEDGQPEALIDAFRSAMASARPASVVRLGTEVARVARDLDLNVAIETMRRVRAAAPNDIPSLRTLADLYTAQQTWPEAVEVLEQIAGHGDTESQLAAYLSLAAIYEQALQRPEDAERALRQALTKDPNHPHALRALLERRRVARASGAKLSADAQEEMADMLGRLARGEAEPERRSELLLELAELWVALGDRGEAERALIEAVVRAPSHGSALGKLAAFHEGAVAAYGTALIAVIEQGNDVGRSEATWFAALGQLQVEHLGNAREGIQHLQRAARMDPRLYDTRLVLAQAFAQAHAPEESARVLMELLVPDARPLLALASPWSALRLLEQQLALAGRSEHALVVTELRTIGGDIDDGKHAALRARRLGPIAAAALDRAALVQHLVPAEARHVLLQVAGAIAGIESKILRTDIDRFGISPKARIGARSGHPTRLLLDRVARTISVPEVELVVTDTVTAPRLIVNDVPWVVVPTAFAGLAEPAQLAALTRVLAPAAWGTAWLDDVSPDQSMALLVAAARRADPAYGAGALDEATARLADVYEPTVARTLSRSQKRALEDLAPALSQPHSAPPTTEQLALALSRARWRAAFVVTGDLLATLDDASACDAALLEATSPFGRRALRAILTHPLTSDVIGFALSGEATALRRRIGSMWKA
jgi:tetratricopeptide (TPR) repeat protein